MNGLLLVVSKPLASGRGYETKVKSDSSEVVAEFIRNVSGVIADRGEDGKSAVIVSHSRWDKFEPDAA